MAAGADAGAARPAALLAALAAFRFDDDRPHWSFAQRLAHAQRWSATFTARVLREYLRFVALSQLAGHPVCPSEQVDLAWHQHLTFTRSYWQRLCGQVLGRELHHHPSQGGADEDDKHRAMYRATLASYRRLFAEEPPADVWPPEAQRFGADVHRVSVNPTQTWLLDKRAVRTALLVLAALLLAALAGVLTA